MAGWSMLTNGCSLDCADISNGCKGSCSCSGANHAKKGVNDDYEVKLRCLFDQVLSIFSNEAASMGCIRPVPALLGDGQSLDLFTLFRVVRKRGGFDMVNGFWTFVVKELGLDLEASTAVKLVYFKYLYELERCLRGSCRDGRLGIGQCQTGGDISCLSVELETEFRSLLSQGSGKGMDGKSKKNGKKTSMKGVKSKIGSLDTIDDHVHGAGNGDGNRHTDDDEKLHDYKQNYSNNNDDDDDDVLILDPIISKKKFKSHKRKRESLSEMLNWVIQIAKCPDDLSIGELPPLSKWKDHKGNELWAQAIRARDALLQRRLVHSNSGRPLLQNNQKMHPSMYEDVTPSDQPTERLRCSERLPALGKPRFCSCCNSCSASQSKSINPPKTEFENPQKEQPVVVDDFSSAKMAHNQSGDEFQRHVLVGRRFQAEVPIWTDMVYESDPKWLGTRVWSLEYGDHNAAVETNYIGKGRPNTCDCQLPGSVECVRFHVAENRIKLKLELGPVFYQWRFDHMGEEISLRWTAADEKRFKDIMRLNPPSLDKSFWNDSKWYFPRKKREELVSYYFNVFLLQRRSYQNRVTPKHIDSDDDESEFGSLSDSYGHKAIKVLGADILICSENKQCTDFD